VTQFQKIVLAVLTVTAVLVCVALTGAIAFLLNETPASEPAAAQAVVAKQVLPASLSTPSATPLPPPPASPVPAQSLPPSPTSTRVVTATVLPSATPTPMNCINNITNFEASELLTNEQVQIYLRETIPPAHLDHCQVIEYQARTVSAHATPVSGSFTPMFRQIYVYASSQEFQSVQRLLDTLTHEIGHNVHYNMRRDNWDTAARWTELYRQSQNTFAGNGLGFVSDYARFNDFEDFAETYRAYIRDPEFLRGVNPEKYEFMRLEVFEGQEYLR
jgi:hypothetical protein